FNSSEEDPDSSQTPYTGTDRDLGSVSQGGSTGATRLPDIFLLGSESVPQGGAHSGSGDKTRLRVVPQEIGHNGQEKAVSVIFDPVHTAATHSLTDTRLSFTEKEHGSSIVGAGTPHRGLSSHMLSAAINVNTLLHTTEVHSGNTHKDFARTQESKSGDITVMSSAPTASPPYLTTPGSSASVTESQTLESPRFHMSDVSVMSSSYGASEDTSTTHNSRTTLFSNHTNPDLSVTGGSDTLVVPVSDLTVSEFGDMTSVREGAPSTSAYTEETESIRTHRLPRSTLPDGNVSNHTYSSLFDDPSSTESPTASGSHPHIDTSALTDGHVDAPENITTTDRMRTEDSSYTLSYTRDTTSPDSTRTHASDTEHTTLERTSDADTQHTSSGIGPTRSYLSFVTWMRQGFTWTPTSYPGEGAGSDNPHTITTRGNDLTATVHGGHAPYDTTEAQPSTDVSTHILNENENENAATATSSPSHHADPRTATVTQHAASTSREHPEAPTSPNAAVTPPSRLTSPYAMINSSTIHTSQTSHPVTTTHTSSHLTTLGKMAIVPGPDTTTQQAHTDARSHPGTHTPVIAPTSSHTSGTHKDWSQKGRVFITEDRPAIIGAETFQVLLQVVLEENLPPNARLDEVEHFLRNVAGYQRQDVTWHSVAVLQSVVTFRTAGAVSWLGRAESLLKKAGLRPLPKQGVFVSGIRVKNITVGGLHSDVCSWLFSCPSNFFCISSEGNISCRSMCHSEYCKNHGICVHRTGQNPLCQCPVGEDFWFMGQRCDLRMTRQRLAGVCFGVLVAIAALMALLAYLAVLRFKRMLIQAKAEQTQSSYRRFNHFDELSARFWRRSWPGSTDSLDNTAFSHSDELLHMRALDRPCCYHDDTLSIASTYPDSVTHLNTVYPHGSQYHWDMSTCSLADGVVDSGKASDLSVCSWPIEPIQWTPFPLLQQLRNSNT
ncbi:threonine-rich GPI-anchored glycoprotein, partial [Clarias magur]